MTIVRGQRGAALPDALRARRRDEPVPVRPRRTARCRCGEADLARYRRRLSGALLDRIDLLVAVERPTADDAGRRCRAATSRQCWTGSPRRAAPAARGPAASTPSYARGAARERARGHAGAARAARALRARRDQRPRPRPRCCAWRARSPTSTAASASRAATCSGRRRCARTRPDRAGRVSTPVMPAPALMARRPAGGASRAPPSRARGDPRRARAVGRALIAALGGERAAAVTAEWEGLDADVVRGRWRRAGAAACVAATSISARAAGAPRPARRAARDRGWPEAALERSGEGCVAIVGARRASHEGLSSRATSDAAAQPRA